MTNTLKLAAAQRPRYRSYLKVRSFGSFPVDMLRYDNCRPLKEIDAHGIQQSFLGETVVVMVVRDHVDPDPRWTPARWRSFGCKVVSVSTEQAEYGPDTREWTKEDEHYAG